MIKWLSAVSLARKCCACTLSPVGSSAAQWPGSSPSGTALGVKYGSETTPSDTNCGDVKMLQLMYFEPF